MKRVAITMVAICAIAVLALWALGSSLSAPTPARMGPPPPALNARTVEFRSLSNARIRGWICVPPEARGAVILLPGVRANRLSMLGRAEFLFEAGYAVLLIDLQGTGESTGDRSPLDGASVTT